MSTTKTLGILDAAATIAWAYGDSETADRLVTLADEVRDTEGETEGDRPLPICSRCGGNVNVAPRVQCQECSCVFSD
jgi:hypothetical protein